MTPAERAAAIVAKYQIDELPVDSVFPGILTDAIAAAIREAVMEEREANAKIVELYWGETSGMLWAIAKQIRQREDQP